MSTPRFCPKCGCTLPPAGDQRLCPRCLLAVGLETEASEPRDEFAATSPHRAAFVPPAPRDLAARFPQFEIIELLGQGGMGAVYKARQKGLDRLVAIKILPPEIALDPSFAERFTREARALARLNHPNIVSVFDFGQAEGLFYIVMEYVEGANVRQMIRSRELKADEALAIVPQICEALQFAHEEGVVHRDIKPENILIDKKGRVKIADFGLAKLAASGADHSLTGTHQVMGTPRYMAPEQIEGLKSVDHRADIYSLGVVFYEMLTGELPLGRFAAPSRKVKIDVRLDDVVLRTLEKEPELRYQQASDVKTAVDDIRGLSQVAVKRVFGREFKSRATLFGLPLIHVAFGLDAATGKPKTAKGIIAIGNSAIGGLAIGGMACGGVAIGGLAVGLVSFAGLALGVLLALGGCAVGGVSFGGVAVGAVAVGGAAVGLYAKGGAAWGVHPYSASYVDPQAETFFNNFAGTVADALVPASIVLAVATPLLLLIAWWAANRGHDSPEQTTASNAAPRPRFGLFIAVAAIAGVAVLGTILVQNILARAAPAAPVLSSPPNGAELASGDVGSATTASWEFVWNEVPGAEKYQLVVEHPSGPLRPVDLEVQVPRYVHTWRNAKYGEELAQGWTWKVRAQVDGRWSDWSAVRTFSLSQAQPGIKDAQDAIDLMREMWKIPFETLPGGVPGMPSDGAPNLGPLERLIPKGIIPDGVIPDGAAPAGSP